MDWTEGLGEGCRKTIGEAIEQLDYDERYEEGDSWTVAQTIESLRDLERHSEAFVALVEGLSPVGQAAMFEAGENRRIYTGRYELSDLSKKLEEIAVSANRAADILKEMHSPTADVGQGSGSAMGRDSDLRAIRVDHDYDTDLSPFRSPKDKFAVRVIAAIIGEGFDPSAPRASRSLTDCLDAIWRNFREGSPPNWSRVVKERKRIAAWVDRQREAKRVWKAAQSRNGSSGKRRRCPPGESPSYVVAPDQTGDCDVDLEGKRRSDPAGSEREHSQ